MTTDLRDKTVEELFAENYSHEDWEEVAKELARRIAEAEQQIAERDAMLSESIEFLRRIYTQADIEIASRIVIFLDALPASAKANADVLRAAREWEKNFISPYHPSENRLAKAVRAAKEIEDNGSASPLTTQTGEEP